AKIQEQYRERVNRRDRGVKQAGFWVISFTTMPSILTELGFLTNKEEEDFLNSENGQAYMASAIYRAFKEYKAEIEGVEVSTAAREDGHGEMPEKPKADETQVPASTGPAPAMAEGQVTYKIQLFASSHKVPLEPANFHGLEDIEEYESDDIYKYTVGSI